jgi:hypothetical protein
LQTHLFVSVIPVLLPHIRDEGVVYARPLGEEETGARGELVEEEEVVLHAEDAVVALLGLLDAVLIVLHLLVVYGYRLGGVEGGIKEGNG